MGMFVVYYPQYNEFDVWPLGTTNVTVPISLTEWLVPGTWVDEDE